MERYLGWILVGAAALAAAAGGDVIEDIEAELASNPNNADLYFELAMAYEEAGDWRGAVDAYVMAIGLAPTDAYLHFRLAEVYFAVEKFGLAIDSYRQSLSLDPGMTQAHYQMGRAYLGLKQYPEAAAALTKFAEASPYDFNGLWYLGQALEKDGRKKEALAYYKKILDYSTGAFASAGEVGVFGTSDDLAEYIKKLDREIYGE